MAVDVLHLRSAREESLREHRRRRRGGRAPAPLQRRFEPRTPFALRPMQNSDSVRW